MRRRAGSLLVVTLWLVTILSLLAVAIGRYLSTEVRIVRYQQAREQAKALARSGVYLALQRLALDQQEAYDWLGDDWAVMSSHTQADPTIWVVDVPSGTLITTTPLHTITITIADEERKLDINAVTAGQLESFIGTGPLPQDIVDYIDQQNTGERSVDEPPYVQKNAPVAALEELRAIPGMTNEVFAQLQHATAVFPAGTTTPTVNINTAEPEVLLAIVGGTTATLDSDPALPIISALVESRPGVNGILGDDDDCKATDIRDRNLAAIELGNCALSGRQQPFLELLQKANFSVSSSTFRITVEVFVQPQGVRYHVVAVVQRPPPGEPPAIVAWREG